MKFNDGTVNIDCPEKDFCILTFKGNFGACTNCPFPKVHKQIEKETHAESMERYFKYLLRAVNVIEALTARLLILEAVKNEDPKIRDWGEKCVAAWPTKDILAPIPHSILYRKAEERPDALK